jgi:hypothetical protein
MQSRNSKERHEVINLPHHWAQLLYHGTRAAYEGRDRISKPPPRASECNAQEHQQELRQTRDLELTQLGFKLKGVYLIFTLGPSNDGHDRRGSWYRRPKHTAWSTQGEHHLTIMRPATGSYKTWTKSQKPRPQSMHCERKPLRSPRHY